MSGTSMAAPHVAGSLALLWSGRRLFGEKPKDAASVELFLRHDWLVPIAATSCATPTSVPNYTYGHGSLHMKVPAARVR